MELFRFDESFEEFPLCGVDEAGRGALAGPVVAAAVILKRQAKYKIPDVYDSKKFSQKKREMLYKKVLDVALDFAIGVVPAKKIDEVNILNATMLAMQQATKSLKVVPDMVLIDGNRIFDSNLKSICIVKGDRKSACIAAASIVAKVTRDFIMKKLGEKYCEYAFEKNKGYGTKEHFDSILKYGVTPQHRKTFLKKLDVKKFKIQNISGKIGEKVCFAWLKNNGYNLVCKNYRCAFGEIDLIATKGGNIYFIEVKLRKSGCGYLPKECVDFKKQKKIIRTASIFIKNHPNKYQPRFAVAEILRKELKFELNFIDNAFSCKSEYELFK